MTFNPRRRRRSSSSAHKRLPVLRRTAVIIVCLGLFIAALVGGLRMLPARADPAAAQASVARSEALLKASNFTAARLQALDAVRADPKSGAAHMVLARALLSLGDGVGAEAEIGRATANGFDAKRIHPWLAQAELLQGDADRALAETDKTDPRDRADGLRIRARALLAKNDFAGARDALDQAGQLAPSDATVWADAGRLGFASGDVVGAINATARALKLDPGNIDALVLRGQLIRAQYGLVAALPWFEAALKRDPAYHDALIEYAATLGDAGRTVEMLAATRRALDARAGSPQAYYLQAVLAARAGDYPLARALLQQTNGSIDNLPGVLLLGGSLDLEAGGYEQAIEKLRQLVAMQPMNLAARRLLAVALMRSDASRNALDLLRPMMLRGDADSYTLTLAARAFERIGDRANAARFLDRAAWPDRGGADTFGADDSTAVLAGPAAAAPDDPAAAVPYIRALAASGDKEAALARARTLADSNPGAPGGQLAVGDVLMLLGRFDDAAAAYKRAADIRFDEPVMLRLVEALDRAGHREDASNTLALFLSQNPVNAAALRLSAHWQIAAGDYDSAIAALEDLRARIGPRDAALEAELATAYAGAGDLDSAQDHAENAFALAPGNPAAADAWGWALVQAGDAGAGVELLQKAVALAPGHGTLRWHLAQGYDALARTNEARTEAQAALNDPGFADRAAAQALLAKAG